MKDRLTHTVTIGWWFDGQLIVAGLSVNNPDGKFIRVKVKETEPEIPERVVVGDDNLAAQNDDQIELIFPANEDDDFQEGQDDIDWSDSIHGFLAQKQKENGEITEEGWMYFPDGRKIKQKKVTAA